jgi:hypothetical protein
MEYERQEIKQSFWEGVTLWKRPELPKIEFKKGRNTYKVTDVRCLNQVAVDIFVNILSIVCANQVEEVGYDVTQLKENEINLISDILSGIECECKYRGGRIQTVFLVSGCRIKETKKGKKEIVFELVKENANAIYEYAQTHKEKNNVFGYLELALVVVDESKKRMQEAFKKCADDNTFEKVFGEQNAKVKQGTKTRNPKVQQRKV